MYSDRLLDYFRNPRNVGELPAPAVTVEVTNPACGDIMRLSVRFEDAAVAEARYRTRGCTASIAAGSALTEWLAGKPKTELERLRPAAVEDHGGLRTRHGPSHPPDLVRSSLRRASGGYLIAHAPLSGHPRASPGAPGSRTTRPARQRPRFRTLP